MSLINEALKKAQRQRTDQAGATPAEPNGPIVKRDAPKSAQTTLLIAVGAILLVVVSVVTTVYWLSRPSPHPAASAPVIAAAPAAHETSATVTVPATTPLLSPAPHPAAAPAETVAATPAPAPVQAAPRPAPASSPAAPATRPAPTPAPMITPAPAKVAAAEPVIQPAAAQPDERVQRFVEALRVTGIRSSGSESKVLMNDRVYRVNDIVDRALGVRLTKVSADSLTFTDANGVTYVKYF